MKSCRFPKTVISGHLVVSRLRHQTQKKLPGYLHYSSLLCYEILLNKNNFKGSSCTALSSELQIQSTQSFPNPAVTTCTIWTGGTCLGSISFGQCPWTIILTSITLLQHITMSEMFNGEVSPLRSKFRWMKALVVTLGRQEHCRASNERKTDCNQQQQLLRTKLSKLENTSSDGRTEAALTILTTTSVPLVPLENSL